MHRLPKSLIPILIVFFCSGVAGLVYEVVWIRQLSLILGATSYAISTVFAAFMAGLGLGSLVLGRLSTHIRWTKSSLRLFAIMELAIGIYGLCIPYIFTWIDDSLAPSLFRGGWTPEWIFVLRFGIVFASLLIPTALMGGTLPLLIRFFSYHAGNVSEWAGLLYGLNTGGAILGACLGGFILIPVSGLKGTLLTACYLNLIVFVVAYITSIRISPIDTLNSTEAKTESTIVPVEHEFVFRFLAFLAYGLSGFASLYLEVAWSRALTLILGSSVYAVSFMLAVFLGGLAAGSLAMGAYLHRKPPDAALMGVVFTITGIAVAASCALLGKGPLIFLVGFSSLGSNFIAVSLLSLFIIGVVIFPATLMMGASFPIATGIANAGRAKSGWIAGSLLGLNTFGGIIGSLVGGFYLLGKLGAEQSIAVSAWIYALIGSAILITAYLRKIERTGFYLLTLVTGFIVLQFGAPSWDLRVMTSGVYIYADKLAAGFDRDERILYSGEGVNATVTVRESGGVRSLRINGKTDGSDGEDMYTQVLLGALPMMLNPEAKDVFVLGWGTGVTVRSALAFNATQVDCLEIEEKVVEASDFFTHVNKRCRLNPRVNLVIEDARQFLKRTDEQYDVIISEPSNPWIRGVSSLFTLENYKLFKDHLKPGGVVCQWVQLYQIETDYIRMILNTFRTIFPHFYVFKGSTGDILLIGLNGKLRLDWQYLSMLFEKPEPSELLKIIDFTHPNSLLESFLVGSRDLDQRLLGAGFNTDGWPLLEFSAARGLFQKTHEKNLEFLQSSALSDLPEIVNSDDKAIGSAYLSWTLVFLSRKNLEMAAETVKHAREIYTAHPDLPYISGLLESEKGNIEKAKSYFEKDIALNPNSDRSRFMLGVIALKAGQMDDAKRFLQAAVELNPNNIHARQMLEHLP